ncbi:MULTISPECIES: membrane protein [Streptomyces]|uniref:membrane protein n=1 Tax=Streptomyces TaxID=1883 RepID=UPI0004CCEA29|nr:membrane protein [Streptomyces durhamensis]
MSRETDTPSSGPNGRGGAAYPSGTPPYGTPMASGDGADAGRSATRPEEKKTETTLTTRIRINIPGSRPIPPVVVRTPVGDTGGAGDETPADPRPAAEPAATAAGTGAAAAEAAAEPAAQAEEKTSDWFAPRKSTAGKGGPGGAGTNGAGTSGGSTPAAGASGTRTGGPGASGTAGNTGARPGGGRPGGVVGSMSVPGASRSGGTNGKGLPGATGGPVAPGHGGGTGSFDVTEALAAGTLGGGSRPGASGGDARRDDLPYFSENGGRDGFGGTGDPDAPGTPGPNGQDGFGGTAGATGSDGPGGLGGPGGPSGFNGPRGQGGPGGPQGPAGPTSGPVTGDGPLVPAPGGPGPDGGEPFDGGPLSGGSLGTGGYGGPGTQAPRSALADLEGPAIPGAGPAGAPTGLGAGGRISDDTAILTPQKPAPGPGTPGYRPADNVSGHTVTSGIPVVPGAGTSPFGGTRSDGPGTQTASAPAPKAQAKPKKKGRSKLVLLGAGVVVVAGGAYGAGLLMNHTDVPKGTTVLGVDIGGGTRDDAVKKLDDAFGSRVNKPLKLSVGGRTVTLTPENAGLQFDFQATVSKAATSDYNPVHVIGSLFGQKRVIDPEMPVDEEKLQAALQQAGGGSGSVTEGGIDFKPGAAVAVYGKAGKAIDAAQATQAVEQAYRTMVETDTATAVTVPSATKQPTVSKAEVDRELKEFAQPAMSAKVTVSAGAGHVVLMSPEKSLWKFLKVVPTSDGKLVDKPDLAALKQLYGKTFDGVLITRGNNKKTPVTPQDVYVALRQALISRTNRVAVIDTNPS